MPLPDAVRPFNRMVTNRALGVFAGRVPPFATVIHQGRRTGQTHRTVVWAFRSRDAIAIACTYGTDVDWAQNLLSAKGGAIELANGRWELCAPRLVYGDEGRRFMPLLVRGVLAVLRVDGFLVADVTPAG